jgi:hypothetical protein
LIQIAAGVGGQYRRRLNRLLASLVYHAAITQPRVERLLRDGFDFSDLAAYRRILITTNGRFFNDGPLFRDLSPIPKLQEIIASYPVEGFVGVHIRRTDNRKAIAHSPTSAFVELMDLEVRQDERTKFFLSTDAPGEEELLRERFGARVVVHPKKSLDRTDSVAAQDALVDLYCLGNCRKLIGSYWSSFTDTAWQLRGVPYVIARQDGATAL